MREIKFRAWDNIKKEMFKLSATPVSELTISSVPIMQYTGLKDKNGKEIYEGDIISGKHYVLGKVEWDDYKMRYVCERENGTFAISVSTSMVVLYGGHVIGNIYENPELLNNK